jgi:hypothetical protein
MHHKRGIRVLGWVRLRGRVDGAYCATPREALKSFAKRFLEKGLRESDILAVYLYDSSNDNSLACRENVLTQPYMRIALIEDGLGLEDPRIPPGIEYLHVKKGAEPPPSLAANGWKYTGSDPQWPKLYDLYSREKKKV